MLNYSKYENNIKTFTIHIEILINLYQLKEDFNKFYMTKIKNRVK
jgi:hypothetical protein